MYAYADFYGSLLKDLYGAGVEAKWTIGPVTISSNTEFRNLMVERNAWNLGLVDVFVGTRIELAVQQFSIEIKF